MHKAVTGRGEAKKLLSRRRQSNCSVLTLILEFTVSGPPNFQMDTKFKILRSSRPPEKKQKKTLKREPCCTSSVNWFSGSRDILMDLEKISLRYFSTLNTIIGSIHEETIYYFIGLFCV